MATVILKDVSVRGDFAVQGGLNLEIRDREFVVLTGPAGCGISTIVRMIAGLEEVSRGEILLGERRLNDLPPINRDIALISHDYAPYPRLSISDNLVFGLERRKFSKTEIKKRVLVAAEIVGLQDLLERKPESLSDEERQRIGLARAMVLQPKVFLFDEPFAKLDAKAQTAGRAEIKKLHQRLPATMIYVTHDPIEAMAMGERMVVVNRGMVEQDGTVLSVYDEPGNLFVAGFVGNPPMNLVKGTLKQDRDSLLFLEDGDGTIEIRLPASRFAMAKNFVGKQVVLGIRPEDIAIAADPSGGSRSPAGFKALVERVEPSGAETDLYLQTGVHALICRNRRWIDRGEGGRRSQFEIDLEKAHLFDANSGRLLMQEP